MCLQTKEFIGNGFQILVKERAHELNLNMKHIAQYCGISYASLYNWVSLKSQISEEKIKKLAAVLDLSEKMLMDRYNNALASKKMEQKDNQDNHAKHPVQETLNPAKAPALTAPTNPFAEKVLSQIREKKLSITKICTSMMISQKDFNDYLSLERIPTRFHLEKLARILQIPCKKLEELIIRSKSDETGIIISDLQKCQKHLQDETEDAVKLLGDGLSIGDFLYHFEGMCYSIWKKEKDSMMFKVMPVISVPDEKAMRTILTAEEWTSY